MIICLYYKNKINITKYQAYCASTTKLLGLVGSTLLAWVVNPTCLKWQDLRLIGAGPYFAHNLYAQYAHNASQEKQINVNIDGVDKVIDVSPQYFDFYSLCNLLGVIGISIDIVAKSFKLDALVAKSLAQLGCGLLLLGITSNIVSMCSSDCRDLTFTDHETGEIIPHDIIISSDTIEGA